MNKIRVIIEQFSNFFMVNLIACIFGIAIGMTIQTKFHPPCKVSVTSTRTDKGVIDATECIEGPCELINSDGKQATHKITNAYVWEEK